MRAIIACLESLKVRQTERNNVDYLTDRLVKPSSLGFHVLQIEFFNILEYSLLVSFPSHIFLKSSDSTGNSK